MNAREIRRVNSKILNEKTGKRKRTEIKNKVQAA
tara:strand:- start:62 stop:163 length:102 start_codon:yes stop_codon:yes gene_type:complete